MKRSPVLESPPCPPGSAVQRIGLGTAALVLPYGAPGTERAAPARRGALTALEAAYNAGIRFFDTAPAYPHAEELLGEALPKGDDCLIATKLATPPGGWGRLSPKDTSATVRTSVGESMRRLGREQLDLVQVHNADLEVIARGNLAIAMAELRDEGLVAQLGASVYGPRVALAAIASGAFDAVQIAYNAIDRRIEEGVVAAARDTGVKIITRSVLMRGVLSTAGRELPAGCEPLAAAADRFRLAIGASWEQLPAAALAFALANREIDTVLVGPREEAELHALLEGATRFAKSAEVAHDLPLTPLPDELLDPSRWPR